MTAPKRSRAHRQAIAEFTDRTFARLFQGIETTFDERRRALAGRPDCLTGDDLLEAQLVALLEAHITLIGHAGGLESVADQRAIWERACARAELRLAATGCPELLQLIPIEEVP
jgi:hypothetical protein